MTAKTKYEQTGTEKIFAAILMVVFGGIVLHAPLSVFFGSLLPDYAPLIKSWKELLLLAAAVLAVVIVTRRHMWRELARDWLFRLIVAFSALHFLLLGWQFQGTAPALAGLAIDLRYLLFFALVYVLIKVWPDYRRLMLIIGAIGAAIVVVFGTLQLWLPRDLLSHIGYGSDTIKPYLTVDKNPDYVRINSTLRGPNPVGAYTVIVLAGLAALWIKARSRLTSTRLRTAGFAALTLCSMVTLWISYSRSALVAAVVGIVLIGLIAYGRRASMRVWLAGAGVILLVAIGLIVGRDSSFVANVILHDNPGTGAAVTSNEDHVSSLIHSSDRMLDRPLGAGIGSTGSASLYGDAGLIVENQYLFIAHETGWLGLGLFLAVFAMILWRLWRRRDDWLSLAVFASGIGLALIGILLPVWVDDTVAIIWWGLAGVAVGSWNMVDGRKKGNYDARKQTK